MDMAAYRTSQKDATRLHAREATFVQTPEGPGAALHGAHDWTWGEGYSD